MREIISVEEDVSIEVRDTASADYLQVLQAVEFGSEGLRYRRVDAQDHVSRLGSSFFFVAYRDATPIGIYALTPGRHAVAGRHYNSVYRSQLCVISAERRRGVAHVLRSTATRWICTQMGDAGFFTWGCIDASNTRVLNFLRKSGLHALGTLNSYLCYRQWPRADPALNQDTSIFEHVDTVTIELRHYGVIPELLNKILLRHVGPAKRRFDPQRFRYARLPLAVLEGPRAQAIEKLVPHAMALNNTHYAVVVCDAKDPEVRRIRAALGRFVLTTKLEVMIENMGLSNNDIMRIENAALTFSPLDI